MLLERLAARPARSGLPVVPVLLAIALSAGTACGQKAPASAAPGQQVGKSAAVRVGTKVPAFSLPRVDGKGIARVPSGKVTLVAFWALGWGGGYGLARLEELHRRYAKHGLDVVIVSHDESNEMLSEVIQQQGITCPLVWDEQHRLLDQWKPENIMSAYVVDREGVVRLVRFGGKESAPSNLTSVDDELRQLLGLPASAVPRGDGPVATKAAAPDPSGPSTLRIAAVMGPEARLRAWGKDQLVVDAGLFVYGTRAGSLALLGSPRDYAIDSGGDDLVGPGTRSPLSSPARRLAPWPQQLVLVTRSAIWWDARSWNGTRWGKADVDPQRILDTDFEDGSFSDGCKPVLTADDDAYASCGDRLTRIVEVGHTEPIELQGLSTLREGMPVAVAHDGAVWFGKDDHVRRVAHDGAVTELVLPPPGAELARPTFAPTGLEPARTARSPMLSRIVPLTDGSIWFLAYTAPPVRRAIVYRHGPGEPAPIVIGSPYDQQVEVRNAVGVRPWRPSCPQAFVAAADPRRTLGSWAEVLRPTLEDARRSKVAAHLVEGRLGERSVRGVVLYLSEPHAEQGALARITSKLIAQLGAEGGAQAEAFCSVPVVTKTFGDSR